MQPCPSAHRSLLPLSPANRPTSQRFLIRRTFRLRHSILVQRSGRKSHATPSVRPPARRPTIREGGEEDRQGGGKGMLHARTHPQCSRSRAGSRVQLVSVVIGPTILPTDAKCTRAREGKEGSERLDWCCGADLNRYLAGRRGRHTHGWEIIVKGCVIPLPAARPFLATSTDDIRPQVTLFLSR